ncbi:hypothetical protein [Thalassotalea sp. G2M2-11]|uniref:hypothetical protein n=1 Tax=Thalassotalea sp. G2M2-11 TaxID=2787627 RepID=UPI0019D10781|nr:hypothetical protein [Thalassotalea sp. G2M2-11]
MKLLSTMLRKLTNTSIMPLISFQMTSFILPWLITIWYTHQQDLQAVGNFTFALAIIAPISLLLASPSRNFLLTQTAAFNDAFASRLLLLILGLIVVAIIGSYYHHLLLFCALFLFKSAELLYDLPISSAMAHHQIKKLWQLNFSKWAVIIVLAATGYFSETLEWLFVLGFVIFVMITWLTREKSSKKLQLPRCFAMLIKAMPLSISTLIFAIHFNIPRYVIASFEQPELLAIFSISSFLVMAAVVLANIFVQAKLPLLKTLYVQHAKQFHWHLLTILAVIMVIFIIIQIAQWPFFSDVFWQLHNNVQRQQAQFSLVFQQTLLMAWGPLLFSASNYILMLTGQHITLVILTSINLLITALLCFFAFQFFGFFALLMAFNLGCLLHLISVWLAFTYHWKNNG